VVILRIPGTLLRWTPEPQISYVGKEAKAGTRSMCRATRLAVSQSTIA